MLSTLVSSLVVLASSQFVSAAAPPPFARANLVAGALGPLSGNVLFTMSGDGCQVDLEISGFPLEGGPWPYHVHQYAVTGNNCSTAGAPFALNNETAIPVPCPPSDAPGGCRAGDMAGQFGNLTSSGSVMKTSYYDRYISLDPSKSNYVGNLSFNVHWSNFTVIACANIEMNAAEVTTTVSTSTSPAKTSTAAASSTKAATSSGLPVFTSGASAKIAGGLFVAIVGGLATLFSL